MASCKGEWRIAILFLAIALTGCKPKPAPPKADDSSFWTRYPKVTIWERLQMENGKQCIAGALENDSSNELINVEVYGNFLNSRTNSAGIADGKLGDIGPNEVHVFRIPINTNSIALEIDGVNSEQGPCDFVIKVLKPEAKSSEH